MHMESGENQPGTREFVVYGVPVTEVGSVTATGAGNYTFSDDSASPGRYTYFVVPEDNANQFGMSAKITGTIPPRGVLIQLR